MNYSVLWLPNAENELAAIWMAASDRDAVTRASHEVDQRLQTNAPNEGESRNDGLRVLLVPPLGILFGVEPGTTMVLVAQVWIYHKRGTAT